MSKGALVELENFSYFRHLPSGDKKRILNQLNLEIYPGTLTLIAGPSGAGKSTLLAVLAGIYPAWGGESSGHRSYGGLNLEDLGLLQKSRLIGYLPQDPSRNFLFPTVQEECEFSLKNLDYPQAERGVRLDSLLTQFGIAHLAGRNPQNLSGGEQALVALASACATQPQILLLDEPLAYLDGPNINRFVQCMRILKSQGTALVVCDHRFSDMGFDADQTLTLIKGTWGTAEPPKIPAIDMPTSQNMTAPPGLSLHDVGVRRGDRELLRGLTFEVRPGELVYLTGHNGIGKSTLIRMIAGFEKPSSGQIEVQGPVRMLGQNPHHHLCRSTVRKEFLTGSKKGKKVQVAQQALKASRLSDHQDQSPFTLSEGEKRRLVFASVKESGAALLLLDEPTAGLDPAHLIMAAQELAGFVAQGGIVVCATHDPLLMDLLPGREMNLEAYAVQPVTRNDPTRETVGSSESKNSFGEPRVLFSWFLLAAVGALMPWPRPWLLGALGLILCSYLVGNRLGEGFRFLKTVVLFCLFPAFLLFFSAGIDACVDSLFRVLLLSLIFHRYALAVEGKKLMASLSQWGLPYPMMFSFMIAWNMIPSMSLRLTRLGESLVLRFQNSPRRRVSSALKPRTRPLFSLVGFRFLFLPVTVLVWEQAWQLAINLDLKNFQGKLPLEDIPRKLKKWEWVVVSLAGCLGAAGLALFTLQVLPIRIP